jgi:hypothetical protein
MVGGKCIPEVKIEPSHKPFAIDLEIKVRITYTVIHKYNGWESLSATARELGFAV